LTFDVSLFSFSSLMLCFSNDFKVFRSFSFFLTI